MSRKGAARCAFVPQHAPRAAERQGKCAARGAFATRFCAGTGGASLLILRFSDPIRLVRMVNEMVS